MKFSLVNGELVTTTKIGNTEISFSTSGKTAVSHKIGKHFSVGSVDGKSFTATHIWITEPYALAVQMIARRASKQE